MYLYTYNTNVCECQARASLAVHKGAQTGLALHDAVWDAHFAAESGQEQHQLEQVDIQIRMIKMQ